MSKQDRLQGVLTRMEKLHRSSDPAVAHIDADKLLTRAIRVLADGTDQQGVANRIVKTFNTLDRWYE